MESVSFYLEAVTPNVNLGTAGNGSSMPADLSQGKGRNSSGRDGGGRDHGGGEAEDDGGGTHVGG